MQNQQNTIAPNLASKTASAALITRYGVACLCLAGPTASGKSGLAVRVAQAVGGVVINCDSMQVYRDLHILTARPSADEQAGVPHLLFGTVDGLENYSVGKWARAAQAAFEAAWQAGQLPILVGGSGLYFRAVCEGLSAMPEVPEAVRAEVRAKADGVATEALHQQLVACDAEAANTLRPTDRQRILRALELFATTGVPLSTHHGARAGGVLADVPCGKIFLNPARAKLYEKIAVRFDDMLAAGALEEVRTLGAGGLDPALPVMRAHGVPHLLAYQQGAISLDVARENSVRDTRHYAKRQMTWARHQMPDFAMVAPEEATAYIKYMLPALSF